MGRFNFYLGGLESCFLLREFTGGGGVNYSLAARIYVACPSKFEKFKKFLSSSPYLKSDKSLSLPQAFSVVPF